MSYNQEGEKCSEQPIEETLERTTLSSEKVAKQSKEDTVEVAERSEEETLEVAEQSKEDTVEVAERSEEEPHEGVEHSSELPKKEPIVEFADEDDCNCEQRKAFDEIISLHKKVTVMVAGKPRMGKSTAFNNLFGVKLQTGPGADSVTITVVDKTVEHNGVQVRYIDTPGLQSLDIDDDTVLEDISKTIGQDDDSFTLLYCVSVLNSFTNDDVAIVRSLNKLFGACIWTRCILVLTYCDMARCQHFAKNNDEDYKKCLKSYVENFKKVLGKCKISAPPVKLIFDCQDETTSPDTIVAVPVAESTKVGRQPNILPDLKIADTVNWSDWVFVEILKKSGKFSLGLVRLRYNLVLVPGAGAAIGAAAIGAVVGASPIGAASKRAAAIGGAVIGAVVGAGLGVAGGPIGIAAGATAGAIAGAAAGSVVGDVESIPTSAVISALFTKLEHSGKEKN